MSYWTKERTHRLITLWVEGLTAEQIATQPGEGVSRPVSWTRRTGWG